MFFYNPNLLVHKYTQAMLTPLCWRLPENVLVLGVGGGSMSVPFLTWCNIAIRNAVATSSAIGLPIAIAGVSGYIITGWNVDHRPVLSLGFVNIPAFFSIVVASTLFAPVGARIAHRISPRRLKLFFGYFLLILSIKILYA